MKVEVTHTSGPLPAYWTIKSGILKREDGVMSSIVDKSGKIDRNMVATILDNYDYNDHARRWTTSPLEAAVPELLEACKEAAVFCGDSEWMVDEGVSITLSNRIGKLYIRLTSAIAKAEEAL